jgi:hypothetical protein
MGRTFRNATKSTIPFYQCITYNARDIWQISEKTLTWLKSEKTKSLICIGSADYGDDVEGLPRNAQRQL